MMEAFKEIYRESSKGKNNNKIPQQYQFQQVNESWTNRLIEISTDALISQAQDSEYGNWRKPSISREAIGMPVHTPFPPDDRQSSSWSPMMSTSKSISYEAECLSESDSSLSLPGHGVGDCGQEFSLFSQQETKGASRQGDSTGLMLRNIPTSLTREKLMEVLAREGWAGRYTFLYLPVEFVSGVNYGYAFLNLTNWEDSPEFSIHFLNFQAWGQGSDNPGSFVMIDAKHTCLQDYIARYRNSPVMSPSVPDAFKPLVFSHGRPVDFPLPDKVIFSDRLRVKTFHKTKPFKA